MGQVYLILRGGRPDYHRAPYHSVILCDRKKVAHAEAYSSGGRDWVWEHDAGSESAGWLITRWEGLDIDYGHVVHGFTLPDGTGTGFFHKGYPDRVWVWELLFDAVWWSSRPVPKWLQRYGVKPPEDEFSQRSIERTEYQEYEQPKQWRRSRQPA